jgi:hypothetical protein
MHLSAYYAPDKALSSCVRKFSPLRRLLLLFLLTPDAEGRPWERLEPLLADPFTAAGAGAVIVAINAPQSCGHFAQESRAVIESPDFHFTFGSQDGLIDSVRHAGDRDVFSVWQKPGQLRVLFLYLFTVLGLDKWDQTV